MEIVLGILAIIIFLSYPSISIIKFGLQESLSFFWYKWQEYGKTINKPYLGLYWTVWCGLLTTILIPLLYLYNTSPIGLWCILPMCLGLISVGASPAYLTERFNIYHMAGAIIAAISAAGYLFFNGFVWESIPIIGAYIITQFITKAKDFILFAELGIFSVVMVYIIKHLF